MIGERTAHDETGVTMGTTKINQTTLSQQDDMTSTRQCVAIDLKSIILMKLRLTDKTPLVYSALYERMVAEILTLLLLIVNML